MKRVLLFLTVLLWSGTWSIQAASVSLEQAKRTAYQFMNRKVQVLRMQGRDVQRIDTSVDALEAAVLFNTLDKAGQPYLYLVNFPDECGFVLVSGDDRFAPVLGYSETGSFNEQDMPENMRAWLQGYIDEMKYWASVDYELSLPPLSAPQAETAKKFPIEPLIQTLWSQGTPYNNLCPIDPSTYDRCLTGCVATAMAQVVNYHMQHYSAPTVIIEDIDGYTTDSCNISMAGIPAGTLLPDRTLLKNIYDDNATAAECTAVAQLMLYCGTSVQMNYQSSLSGALFANVATAMMSKFGFDASTHYVERANYTYAQWIDLLYAELAAARPIVLSGHSSGSGHAFITDGYSGDDFFHINWGWSGSANGYFAMSVLNPDDAGQAGASSSNDGYNADLRAIIECQITGEQVENRPHFLSMNIWKIENETIYYSAYNRTSATRSFELGIGYIDEEENISPIYTFLSTDLKDRWGYSNLCCSLEKKTSYAGMTKKIVPISREISEAAWRISGPDFNYVIATFDEKGVPHLSLYPVQDIEGANLIVPTSKFANEAQRITVDIVNKGNEFYGKLYLFVSQTSAKGDYYTWLGITSLANSTTPFTFVWTPETAGTYNLWVALDENGTEVLASSSVTITEDPALQGKTLAVVDISFEGMDNNSWQIDDEMGIRMVDVYADSLVGKIGIRNLTNQAVNSITLRVEFDQYDSINGEFVKETYNRVWNTSIPANTTYYYKVIRTDLELHNIYRIRISNRQSASSVVTEYDDHIRIRWFPAILSADVENIYSSEVCVQKILRDGQILIIRGDKTYTIQGQLCRIPRERQW